MNQHKLIERASLAFCFIVFPALISVAQSDGGRSAMQVEPSYDIALHLVIGANDGASKIGGELPPSLANMSRQLKANFAFTNYRLASTFLGRISNNGTFEYKSVGNLFGKETEASPQTFLEWTLANCRSMPTAKGQPGFQAQAFRFGARVPVAAGNTRTDGGASTAAFNYEAIGLSLGKIGLAENTPTLIGTLNLPGANGTIFLIMTIRATD